MATKSKKTHKWVTVLRILCILIPAFVLVLCYPKIRKSMDEYDEISNDSECRVESSFVNYAMESCYYLYNSFVESDVPKNLQVFNEYGWIKDYFVLRDNTYYEIEYPSGFQTNGEAPEEAEVVGCLLIKFGANGYLEDISFEGDAIIDLGDARTLYEKAMITTTYFANNVNVYNQTYEKELQINDYIPKDFTMKIVLLEESSEFIYYTHARYYSYESQLLASGAIVLMIIAAIFVAVMAFVLGGFKWQDKLPFEILLGVVAAATAGAVGMFFVVSETCGPKNFPNVSILQYPITDKMWFAILSVLNFFGWAILFFLEYIVFATIRQFLSGPKNYLKNRFLCINFVKWIVKLCKKLFHYVTDIDINEKLNNSIIKIVLFNFIILTACCTLWLFGIIGIVIYSVVLYIVLRKYGERLQKQYHSILNTTREMAQGNLKHSVDSELGVFEPLGKSLSEVQKGFEKAVVEEAKSQNMKTELITNVSHDLKTPLTAIITYVDLLKKEDITDAERKSYIETLEQKSQRLKILIEDLFEISKAQSGNVTMNFMDVDVVSLMKQVCMEMEDKIDKSSLTFRFHYPKDKIVLSLDGEKTFRVFENLLSNALKYAMPNSRVYIDIIDSSEEVMIMFRNISAQELKFEPEKLTERFVRGDASRNSEGSGLGLAIAKSFVELQHGKLNIEVDGDLFKVVIKWSK